MNDELTEMPLDNVYAGAASPGTHWTAQSGDSLWKMAAWNLQTQAQAGRRSTSVTGSEINSEVERIAALNHIENKDLIYKDQRINLGSWPQVNR